MSVLFGLYQPEAGKILKNGKEVAVRNPNDANALGIGMVHQTSSWWNASACWITSFWAWSPISWAFCRRLRPARRSWP